MPRFKTCFENAFWAKHVLKTKRWIFEAKQRFGRTLDNNNDNNNTTTTTNNNNNNNNNNTT